MPNERIEYLIRKDGTVEERVEGVPGPRCEKVTESFEAKLGEVVERVHTAEFMLRPTPKPERATQAKKTLEERIGG